MTDKTQQSDQQLIDNFLTANVAFLGPDPEINGSSMVQPRTEWEEEILSKGIDRNVMRDVRSSLQASLDEAFEIAEQTAAAPAAKCADMAVAIFTSEGELSLCSQRGVSGFASIMSPAIRYVLKYFENDPSVGVEEGDAFFWNDARYAGIHSPDMGMFMPVFHQGRRVAWVVCSYHQGETGGREPGGMGPGMESKWDEGLKISPMRVVRNYRLQRDVLTMYQNNFREPHFFYADMKVRLSSCRRLEKGIHEAIETYGLENTGGFLRQNLEDVETEAHRRLLEIPPTTVTGSYYIDSTMREKALLRVNTKITFKDGKVTIDLRGSSPEIANRPINSVLAGAGVSTTLAIATFVWPDLPPSPALINRFEFLSDPASLANASNEVPIALSMQIIFKIITAVEVAFAKATYSLPKERRYSTTHAPWFNQPQTIIYGGITQHSDMVGNTCADINSMPGGARCNADGEHSIAANFAAMTDCGECEDAEEGLPFQYMLGKKIEPDNCGFGMFRGGAGYQYGLIRYGEQPFGFQTIAGGSSFPTVYGLFGGYGSPVYPTAKIKGVNIYDIIKEDPTKYTASMATLLNEQPFEGASYESCPMAWTFEFAQEGDLYIVSHGAGGGYGDVLDRDPAAVIKDLEEGVISHPVAEEIYMIRYNRETLVLDRDATEKARDAERQTRIARGVSYDTFVANEVTDKPELPVPFFGAWNDNNLLFAGDISGAPGTLPPIYLPDPRDVEIAKLKAELAELKAK